MELVSTLDSPAKQGLTALVLPVQVDSSVDVTQNSVRTV